MNYFLLFFAQICIFAQNIQAMATEFEAINFIAKFERLVDGLYVMSETDAPLKPFIWKKTKGIDDALLRKKAKTDADTPIESLEIEDFFKTMTTPQDWHGEDEKAATLKFQQLIADLKAHINEPKVYKVGDAKKEVFIVGKLNDGEFGGLKTLVVET
jgi:hypothetical protein